MLCRLVGSSDLRQVVVATIALPNADAITGVPPSSPQLLRPVTVAAAAVRAAQ